MPKPLKRYTIKPHHTGVLVKQTSTGEYVKYEDVLELIETNKRQHELIIKLQAPKRK